VSFNRGGATTTGGCGGRLGGPGLGTVNWTFNDAGS